MNYCARHRRHSERLFSRGKDAARRAGRSESTGRAPARSFPPEPNGRSFTFSISPCGRARRSFCPAHPARTFTRTFNRCPTETIVQKNFPNSFRETPLLEVLREKQINRLIICGMQTNMCVDAITRAAADYGFECLVAADACAARNLTFDGLTVPAEQVHHAFLAALNGSYAKVLKVDQILAQLAEVQA